MFICNKFFTSHDPAKQIIEITVHPVPQFTSDGTATLSVTAATGNGQPGTGNLIHYKWVRYPANGGPPVVVFQETK